MPRLRIDDLDRVRPLLQHLHSAVLFVGQDGEAGYSNMSARSLFGRRPRGPAEDFLGRALYAELCRPLIDGEADRVPWQETTLDTGGDSLPVAASALGLEYPGGERGALVFVADVSSEVSLHQMYREMLERQYNINQELEREIAARLREHEDDLSLFSEITQVAPEILAAFLSEAGESLALLEELGQRPDEKTEETLRAVHTLKGNARSLGLNFIGGRAHAVEEILRDLDGTSQTADAPLDDLTDDLRRALARARFLRTQLGSDAAPATEDVERHESMVRALELISSAADSLDQEHGARPKIEEARRLLRDCSRLPLHTLFELLKRTVDSVAHDSGVECDVHFEGGGIAVTPSSYRILLNALPHLVRNSVCHGIELPEQRVQSKKPPRGLIEVTAHRSGGVLRVKVRDDGRGLPLDYLRAQAERLGASPASEIETAELIFHPGLSSAEEATMESGRGYGMSAARQAVTAAGGYLEAIPLAEVGVAFRVILED